MNGILLGKDSGDPNMKFLTKENLFLIAKGCERVVISARGIFIEFTKEQIQLDNLYIPNYALYRIKNKNVFYTEYRTKKDNVMVYFQKKLVNYADYKLNHYYIDPKYLLGEGKLIIINLEETYINLNQSNIEKFI